MFELVIEFISSGRVLNNESLKEISSLKINEKTGEIYHGKKKPIKFIISDISLYQGYEYNPDDMSIVKLNTNMKELKQVVKRTISNVDKKDIDIGIVNRPDISKNIGL